MPLHTVSGKIRVHGVGVSPIAAVGCRACLKGRSYTSVQQSLKNFVERRFMLGSSSIVTLPSDTTVGLSDLSKLTWSL